MKRCIRMIILVCTVAFLSSCASTYKPSTKYKPKWRCSVEEQRRDIMTAKAEKVDGACFVIAL